MSAWPPSFTCTAQRGQLESHRSSDGVAIRPGLRRRAATVPLRRLQGPNAFRRPWRRTASLVGIDRPDQMAMATATRTKSRGRFSVSRHVVRVFNAQGGEGRDAEASGACRRQTAEVTSSSNGLSSVAEKRFDASEEPTHDPSNSANDYRRAWHHTYKAETVNKA
jgi:hypothetical protein